MASSSLSSSSGTSQDSCGDGGGPVGFVSSGSTLGGEEDGRSGAASGFTASQLLAAIKDLHSSSAQTRLDALDLFAPIATALGPGRCRDELLKYLEDWDEEDDEVAAKLARCLRGRTALNFVGGAEHANCLLGILTNLAGAAEESVRIEAVQSLSSISEEMLDPSDIDDLVSSLVEADSTMQRVSACGLLPTAVRRTAQLEQTKPQNHNSLSEADKLIELYVELCDAQSALIRRAANVHMPELLYALRDCPAKYASRLEVFLHIMSQFAVDDQETVRIYTPMSVVSLLNLDPPGSPERRNKFESDVLPILTQLADDKSWRVKCMVIDAWPRVVAEGAASFSAATSASPVPEHQIELSSPVDGGDASKSTAVTMLVKFLDFMRDEESEVRRSALIKLKEVLISFSHRPSDLAANNSSSTAFTPPSPRPSQRDQKRGMLSAVTSVMSNAFGGRKDSDKDNSVKTKVASPPTLFSSRGVFLKDILLMERLSALLMVVASNDTSPSVRVAIAQGFLDLWSCWDPSHANEHLLPIYNNLLRDEDCSVRMEAFSVFAKMAKDSEIFNATKQSLFAALVETASAKSWRTRQQAVEYLVELSQHISKNDFNESQLITLCSATATDPTYSVRHVCTSVVMVQLAKCYGAKWASKHILPLVFNLQKSSNYLFRQHSLAFAASLDPACLRNSMLLSQQILQMVVTLSYDPVPNIRLNVARTIEKLCAAGDDLPQPMRTSSQAVLQRLSTDDDVDVRHFSMVALGLPSEGESRQTQDSSFNLPHMSSSTATTEAATSPEAGDDE